jgi:hypothetical protein
MKRNMIYSKKKEMQKKVDVIWTIFQNHIPR